MVNFFQDFFTAEGTARQSRNQIPLPQRAQRSQRMENLTAAPGGVARTTSRPGRNSGESRSGIAGPQGKIGRRFSLDMGIKKTIQKGRGELFLNATDLLNTMVIKKEIYSEVFKYYSSDYYETQVIRLGYAYKF